MGGDSLRPYLKMQNLFCREINKAVSPAIVRATLEKATGPLCKVVIPLDFNTGQSTHIGQAYLNFSSEAEAQSCLDRWRFKLVFGKQRAKLMYAPGGSQSDKDKIWGPYSYKFQIIVKNLSEEVEIEEFYEFFSKFGKILQCKTETDQFGQYFGQVQYMESGSVAAAVAGGDGTRWHSSVIQVVPHHKAATVESSPQPRVSVDVSSTSNFPSLGASSSATAAAGGTPTSAMRSTARVQQQYQPPPAAAPSPAPVNFAVQALESSAGSRSSTAPDSPASRLLATVSSGGGSLHVDAPVVAPVALPVAAPVAAPVSAPVTAAMTTAPLVPVAAPVVAPVGGDGPARLMQTELRAGSTGPGSAASLAAPAGAGRAPAVPVTGPLSLMDRILKHRAEAEAAAGVSAAGSDGGGAGGSGVVSTPTGAAAGGGSNGGRKKGGLLKSLTQSLEQISELLCCPITHEVLRDPVVAADGITYERHAISNWLATHNTSPMTNIQLANLELHPNNLVKTLIEELM